MSECIRTESTGHNTYTTEHFTLSNVKLLIGSAPQTGLQILESERDGKSGMLL